MLRVGMIGAGWHAQSDHAPALRRCADSEEFKGRVELSAVCDLEIEKALTAARQFGFRLACDSIEELLPHVDVVLSIISPAAQRAALFQILEHRKPVLAEKPLGRTLDEAEQIAGMLVNHLHMISLNRRFDPGVVLAREWMSKQSPIRRADGVMLRGNRHEEDFIWSTGVHLTDLMCHLVGEDKIGDIKIGPACGEIAEYVDIFADDWSLRVHTGTHQPWRVIARNDHKTLFDKSADESTPSFERNGTVAETKAFLNAILDHRPMSPTAADALPGTRLTVGYAHDSK